jgi:GNAT superfamily N-acetyltransferase
MITGRWGKPERTLLDITVDEQGNVTGIANPGREDAPIRLGVFDATSGALRLEGEHTQEGEPAIPFLIEGKLEGRTLNLSYSFGEVTGTIELVRVEEYIPPPLKLTDRIKPHIQDLFRWVNSLSRPTGKENRGKLAERGESLESIVFRDATIADLMPLSDLHVETWNATYNTTNGPTVATRAWQWTGILANPLSKDIVVVLENREGRLIGFYRATRTQTPGLGNLSKIYLRWEYHGLGLGRRMMAHVARRFLDRGITSFNLFAERSNPTIGFYDRMGGERMLNEHGGFDGGYIWRDLHRLVDLDPGT